MRNAQKLTWYEFFAGGGMARLGLGERWTCLFANEWCEKKTAAYVKHFGVSPELREADVADLTIRDLPGVPDLVWASFPCQDLSLAGSGAGLRGERSGTFRPFWRLILDLKRDGRAPKAVVLENVVGAITSHNGEDFRTILRALTEAGYHVGPMVIDAVRFVPQSRPRLFVLAVQNDVPVSKDLAPMWPSITWHPRALMNAYARLPRAIQSKWLWWDMPIPTKPVSKMSTLMQKIPTGVHWHTSTQTRALLRMMSDVNRRKVREVMSRKKPTYGTIYKRTRPAQGGGKIQRAEVRFDEISGCLRTPVGGSSRQTVLLVDGRTVKSRLLSPREAARLMGVPDCYPVPANYNSSYHLFGDGVAVPVVRWLETHLLWPLLSSGSEGALKANVA
ncbi:MAG: DNA cytosine methyltransferase [Chthoniobacterales bacterium]